MTTNFLDKLLGAVAPHECIVCGHEGALLCAPCLRILPVLGPQCYRCGVASAGFETCQACLPASDVLAAFVVASYNEPQAKEIIHKLKFGFARQAAEAIACAIVARLREHGARLPDEFVVTHVPTATTRVRQRGFDHAALIARALARQLNAPHAALLARTTQQRQLGNGRGVRREQLSDAYRPLKPWLTQNASILLVDDVITTGSTIEAAAAVLKQAGAQTITAVAFTQA